MVNPSQMSEANCSYRIEWLNSHQATWSRDIINIFLLRLLSITLTSGIRPRKLIDTASLDTTTVLQRPNSPASTVLPQVLDASSRARDTGSCLDPTP